MIRNRFTYLLRKSMYFYAHNTGMVRLPYNPLAVSIEPTNHCNLKCIMCPTGTGKVLERGLMRMDVYQKIINEVKDYAFYVILNIGGESLIHKSFIMMIQIARDAGLWVNFSTNATLLNEEISRQILEAHPTEIIMSFDAASGEKGYEEIRRGASYAKTLDNIITFLKIKKSMGLVFPRVIIQTILFYEQGLNRVAPDDFKRLFSGLAVDEISVEWAHRWAGEFSTEKDYIEPPKRDYFPCTLLWRNMAVGWDGNVFPCCFDLTRVMPLGSIIDKSLLSYWNGAEIIRMRRMLIRKLYKEIDLCSTCGNIWHNEHTYREGVKLPLKETVKKVLRKINR